MKPPTEGRTLTETETEAEDSREALRCEVALDSNIRVEQYKTPDSEGWTDLPKRERLRRLQTTAEPETVGECHNVTCIRLHEYLPAFLNFRNDFDRIADHPDRLAFGDGTATPTQSDTQLNNRVGSVTLTSPRNTGAEWSCTELVGSLELIDEDLYELGVESETGDLYNHALLPEPIAPKTTNDELIVTVTWSFSAP